MGFIDVNGVSFSLPDGRPLLADLAFRVTEGRTTALIGANGAGKSTLLRIIRGDLAARRGQRAGRRRTRRDGPVRRHRADRAGRGGDRAGLLVSVAPRRGAGRGARARGIRGRAHRTRRHRHADALRDRARRVRGGRRLRAGDRLGPLHDGGARDPVRAGEVARARRRSRAASRSGSPSRPCCADPSRCCCSTSPTTRSTCPASAGSRQQLRATPQDRAAGLARPRAAGPRRRPHRHARARGGGQHRVGARRQLRGLPRGARRPVRAPRRAAPALGRAARHAQGSSWQTLKVKATYNDGMASRYQAAVTRLRKFEEAGPPEERPPAQDVSMRLRGRAHRQAGGRRASGSSSPASCSRSTSRSGTATASRCSARTDRASRTSCGCSRAAAPSPIARSGT